MQCIIKDFKVDVLPVKGVPNSRYYVPNGNGTDIDEYVTDKDGEFHKVCCGTGGGVGEETDPIALAKTISLLEGNAIEIIGTSNQALNLDPSWTIHHGNTSSVPNLDTSGAQIIDTITFDTYGHVLTITTRNLTLDDLGYVEPVSGRFGIEDNTAAENRSFDVTGFVFELTGIVQDDGAQQLLALDASSNIVWVDIASITAGGGYSDEQAQDAVFNAIIAGSGIGIAYNDVANTFTISHADTSSVTNLDTSAAQVIDTLTFDTFGHVQTVTTRDLTLTDLGYTVPNAMRFGFPAEDVTATEDRTFDLGTLYGFRLNSLTNYFEIDGSANGMSFDFFSSHPDGRQSGNLITPGFVNFYAYTPTNSSSVSTIFNVDDAHLEDITFQSLSGTSTRSKLDLLSTGVDATSYAELRREIPAGTGAYGRFRADLDGAKLQAKTTGAGTYKGILVKPNTDIVLENYPSTRSDSTGIKALFIADAAGTVSYGPISSTTGQRFGVATEDDIATQNRSFNLNGGNRYWQIVDTGSNYFGLYDQSSGNNMAFEYFFESSTTSNQITQAANAGSGWYSSHYNDSTNGYSIFQAQSGFATLLKAETTDDNLRQRLYISNDGTDATSYTEITREWPTGTGNFGRMRLDVDGSKLQAKTTLGGTYKGLLVKPNTDLVFENYPSSRADTGSTKAFYAADASGTVAYGPISSTSGQRFGKVGEDTTAGEDRTFTLGTSWDFRLTAGASTMLMQEYFWGANMNDGGGYEADIENGIYNFFLNAQETGVSYSRIYGLYDFMDISAVKVNDKSMVIHMAPYSPDSSAVLSITHSNGGFGPNTYGSQVNMMNDGLYLQASTNPNSTIYKGIKVNLSGDLLFDNYPNTRNDTVSSKALSTDASGNVKLGAISSATGQRFGISGEDASSSVDRTMDMNDHDFAVVDANSIYLEVDTGTLYGFINIDPSGSSGWSQSIGATGYTEILMSLDAQPDISITASKSGGGTSEINVASDGILIDSTATTITSVSGGGDVIVGADNTGLLTPVSYADVVAGGQVVIFEWKFSTSVGVNNPGSGNWRADSAVGASTVTLSINDITSTTGFDISALFSQIDGNWLIHIQQGNDATKFIQFTTSGPYIDHTTWWEVPVTYVQDSGFPFANNTKCTFVFVNQNAGGGGQNLFETIAVAGQNNVVADSPTDTLTLVAGTGMTITTDDTTDTITFTAATLSSGIVRVIVSTSGSITLGSSAATDYMYFVTGAHTMSMPTAVANTNRYTVKNIHSANITIDTAGAEDIEGAASLSLAPDSSVDIISNGTNWFII